MFEAYSIGITLRLNNLISPQLALLGKEFTGLEANAVSLALKLKGVGAESSGLVALAKAGNLSSNALEKATRNATLLQAQLTAIRATAAAMPNLAPHITPGAGGGGGPRIAPGVHVPGGGGQGTGGPRGGGGGNRHNGPGGWHGGNIHMGPGGVGIGTIGMNAGNAILPLAITAGALYGGHALYKTARDYETAYTRFQTLNLGADANRQANAFARGTPVRGVSSVDLMETLRESVGMFGSMPNALAVAPVLAQLNAANSRLFGGRIGKLDEGAARSLMRFNDMRGLTDSPSDFMRGLDLAQRMVTGSGGALKFSDLEQMAKRGGAAFKGLSDDGILMLSTLAQEQGGATTGTALMSMYQNLIAGRTTKKTMAALESAGLVKLGEVNTGTVGGKKSTATTISWIKDEKMLRENPGMWLMTYGAEAAKKSGATDDSQTIAFMNTLLSNRTGSNMAANFTTQQAQALRDAKGAKNAAATAQTIALDQKSLSGKEGEFIAAWTSFKTEFGTAALPAFSNLLTNGATFLRGINSFMESPAVKSFISVYQKGFDFQGSVLSKGADLLCGAPAALQGARTGAAVAGNDTGGGAFTGFRSPVRAGNGGGGTSMMNNTIVMPDGRVLANVVTEVQSRQMSRPATGARTADGRMSLRAFDVATGG